MHTLFHIILLSFCPQDSRIVDNIIKHTRLERDLLFFLNMSEGILLFPIPKISILLFLFTVYSTAQKNNPPSSCSSSSCGNIKISYPYRLKSDPRSCGFNRPNFELECRNNQTLLTVTSKTYLVQEINYDFYTIKLIDPNIKKGNLSSCPLYSNYYDDWDYTISSSYFDLSTRVTFIHCLNPVNSSKYVQAPFCGNRSSIFGNSSEFHSYVVTGERITVSDLEDSCTVDRVVLASPVEPMWNNSLASIYDAMANGFEFTWFRAHCVECDRSYGYCSLEGNKINCKEYCSDDTPISELSFKCKFRYWGYIIGAYTILALAGLSALKFVLGLPLLVVLVVYKWRRRHLAMKPSDRPAMDRVVEMLEGDSEWQMPPKPFMAPREIADDHGISTTPPV